MSKEIICPVSFVKADESRIRITAGAVFLLLVIFTVSGYWPIVIFLAADFFVRAFGFEKYSILNIISGAAVKFFAVPGKPTDQAPKRFAAKIGFIFTLIILLCGSLQFTATAYTFAQIMLVFALLESAFAFCAGCYAYTFFKRFEKLNSRILR